MYVDLFTSTRGHERAAPQSVLYDQPQNIEWGEVLAIVHTPSSCLKWLGFSKGAFALTMSHAIPPLLIENCMNRLLTV